MKLISCQDYQRELEDKGIKYLVEVMAKKNTRESEQNSINTKQKQSEAVVYSHGGAYSKLEQVFCQDSVHFPFDNFIIL